jgi:hypothetical protein
MLCLIINKLIKTLSNTYLKWIKVKDHKHQNHILINPFKRVRTINKKLINKN